MRKRIRGTLHSKLGSNAKMFEERGDRWGGERKVPYTPGEASPTQRKADAIRLDKEGGRFAGHKFEGTSRDGSYPSEEAERRRQEFPENPDLDRWTKAGFAKPKPKFVDPDPIGKTEADLQRRAMNIRHSMHLGMARNKMVKVEEKKFSPSPGFSFVSDNAKWEARGGRNRKKAPK